MLTVGLFGIGQQAEQELNYVCYLHTHTGMKASFLPIPCLSHLPLPLPLPLMCAQHAVVGQVLFMVPVVADSHHQCKGYVVD